MKPYFVAVLFLPLFITGPISYAQDVNNEERDMAPRWTCTAYDKDNKYWSGQSSYEIAATNKALAGCKKESQNPNSCRIDRAQCEPFMHHVTGPRGLWKCTALDQMAKPWASKLLPQRDEAALAAKANCTRHSSMPDTCYINLLTCVNANQGI